MEEKIDKEVKVAGEMPEAVRKEEGKLGVPQPKAEVLPKKVTIKQTRKSGLPVEPGHDGEYRYTGTSEFLCPQFKKGTKELVTGLTPEMERALEKKLNLPGVSEKLPQGTLSRYNAEFWATFKIELPKGGKVLDVESDPWHELEWRVLRAHQEVANNEEERLTNGFARYLLTSDEEEAVEINKKISIKRRAYNKFDNMSTENQKDFLRVWNHTHMKSGSKITDDTKASLVEASIGKVVEETPQEFIDVLADESFKTRVLLKKCIDGGLVKKGKGSKYTLPGGEVLGFTLDSAVDFLSDPDNQEIVLSLKTRLQANK